MTFIITSVPSPQALVASRMARFNVNLRRVKVLCVCAISLAFLIGLSLGFTASLYVPEAIRHRFEVTASIRNGLQTSPDFVEIGRVQGDGWLEVVNDDDGIPGIVLPLYASEQQQSGGSSSRRTSSNNPSSASSIRNVNNAFSSSEAAAPVKINTSNDEDDVLLLEQRLVDVFSKVQSLFENNNHGGSVHRSLQTENELGSESESGGAAMPLFHLVNVQSSEATLNPSRTSNSSGLVTRTSAGGIGDVVLPHRTPESNVNSVIVVDSTSQNEQRSLEKVIELGDVVLNRQHKSEFAVPSKLSQQLKSDLAHPNAVQFLDSPSSLSKLINPSSKKSSWRKNNVALSSHHRTSTGGVESVKINGEMPIIENGIYWSSELESRLPKGFSDKEAQSWRRMCSKAVVLKMDEGCGRMQNRLLTLRHPPGAMLGSLSEHSLSAAPLITQDHKSCTRYRMNMDQIQGELFSYYLAQILSLRNLPPSSVRVVKSHSNQWATVGPQLAMAQWFDNRPIVMTKFIDGLEPSLIPEPLQGHDRRLHSADVEQIVANKLDEVRRSSSGHNGGDGEVRKNVTVPTSTSNSSDPTPDVLSGPVLRSLVELAQWSDLLVFDYLTGNLDRVVNNLFNLQWNPDMMTSPAHNLARDPSTGLLLFLDNESGLLHGFRLLPKYEPFHRALLEAVCVFRRPTVDAIRRLAQRGDIGRLLQQRFEHDTHENTPPGNPAASSPDEATSVLDVVPFLPEKNVEILNQRIQFVSRHIDNCEKRSLES